MLLCFLSHVLHDTCTCVVALFLLFCFSVLLKKTGVISFFFV